MNSLGSQAKLLHCLFFFFLIIFSLLRIALPDAFHVLIITPASKIFQSFMDGWRSQYILLRLNEAEQKLAKTGLLSLLFNICNRVILRD